MSAPDRRACRLVLAALLALLTLAGLAAPAAGAPSPTPTPTPTDGLPVRVQITDIAPAVLRPGEDLVVRARLTNTSADEITAPRAVVNLERIRPGSRADLQTWLDVPDTGTRVGARVAYTAAETPLAPGASVDLAVTVAADDIGLLDRPDTWGARGLTVEATEGPRSRVGLQRSFVLWATSDDVAQARVSLLAPVVGPAAVPQDVDVTAPGSPLTELVQPGERLDSALEIARTSPDVALVVDPALLAAARRGTGDVAAWGDDLAATAVGRDVASLPWSDPDLTALAHADATDLLGAAVEASASAAADGVGGGTPLAARTDVLWAPGPTTDQATVDLAAQSGASVLVMAPGDVPAPGDAAGARTTLTASSGTTLVGLVPDATLTTLVSDPGSLDPDATTATVVQHVLAELSVLAHGSPEGLQHVLVALPRDTSADPDLVAAVLQGVQSSPWSRTAPLTALLGAADLAGARTAPPALVDVPDALPSDEVRRLADSRSATVAFAAVTDDAASLLAGVDMAVLAPLATAWRGDPVARDAVVDAVVDDVDARRVGLSLAPASTQRLISAAGEVRFSVRNELPAAASVQVQATPRKACLRTDASATVVVPANGEESVPIAVHAIANCEVEVEAVLTSVDGAPLAPPVTFVVLASPTIESVGTAVVGVLLAVGLVLGVVRTVRRGQSARRGARRVDDEAGTRPLPVLGGTLDGDA